MTCHIGSGAIICTNDGWRVALDVECPWCKEKRRCLSAEVFGGWCGRDYICGTCGSYWDSDSETLQKLTEQKRDENIAQVAAKSDPKCWDCHDTGYLPMSPVDEEATPCQCCSATGGRA